jgi:hypothetical protein
VRSLALLVLLGCGRPARPPVARVNVVTRSCDRQAWQDAAASTQRAWVSALAPPHAHPVAPIGRWPRIDAVPTTVVELAGEDVQIATVRPQLIVTRWLPVSALGRAAITWAAVSPRAGGPPDPAVRIRIGAKLPASEAAWLAVSPDDGLAFAGFVPSSVRGTIWDVAPAIVDGQVTSHLTGPIRAAPRADAAVRATVAWKAAITVHGEHAGWFEVTARTDGAEVDGYIERPPPPPPQPPGRYEFSDDLIEGELVTPPNRWAAGSCLYDRPNGAAVGMILADSPGDAKPAPRQAIDGWSALEVTTPWGRVTYYLDASPLPLPPPSGAPSSDEAWPFNGW